MTVSECAESVGRKPSTISENIKATEPVKCFGTPKQMSIRAATDIASLPEFDWQWFTELCISKEWGEKERSAAIKAVKEINIPEHFYRWLDPLKWKKQAALDAATDPNSDTHKRLARWIATAQQCLDSRLLKR